MQRKDILLSFTLQKNTEKKTFTFFYIKKKNTERKHFLIEY